MIINNNKKKNFRPPLPPRRLRGALLPTSSRGLPFGGSAI
jgi:hypothetical protein